MYGVSAININSDIFTKGIADNLNNVGQVSNETASKTNFGDVIEGAINKVNESQVNANNQVEALIKGEDTTMHEVMLSMQESQMSMQLMIEVRNKIYEAYQEVNRVQL